MDTSTHHPHLEPSDLDGGAAETTLPEAAGTGRRRGRRRRRRHADSPPAAPEALPTVARGAPLSIRTGGGRVLLVPAPLAVIAVLSVFLAAGLAAFEPASIRTAALDRQAESLLRWETAERRRIEKALEALEPELRALRRTALRAGITPQRFTSCGAPDAKHLAGHVAEAAQLSEAVLAHVADADLQRLPWRSPIDLRAGWVISEHRPAREGIHVSSGKGARTDPFTGRLRQHHGIDLSAPEGTPVVATAAGTVEFAGAVDPNRDHARGLLGKHVIVRHGDTGVTTLFAHLSKTLVRKGQEVQAGDPLGEVGSTGRSTAPHLHYQVIRGKGPSRESLDPLYFITDAVLVREGRDVWYVPSP